MDAYCYDFGVHEVVAEVIADYPRYEEARLCGIVIAESRGKAKKLAVDYEARDSYVEWTTPMHLRLIRKDVEGPERVVHEIDDPAECLWGKAGVVLRKIDVENGEYKLLDYTWDDFLEDEGHELIATFGDLD